MTDLDTLRGRALDEAVAVELFGWRWISMPSPGSGFRRKILLPPNEPEKSGHALPDETTPRFSDWARYLPAYSSSWDAMKLVVEEMQKRGWKWCGYGPGLMDDDEFGCYFQRVAEDGGVDEPEADGDSLPTAVARSALKAIRSEKK